jgi:CheY-like chemotaxis protein
VAAQTAERFEAIGRFAAGVVHDFQNYLMVVQGSVDELRVGGEPGRVADVLQGATAATAAMTRQLLATARREDLPAAEVDTREVVEQTLRLLQPGFPSGIQILRELAPGASVLADPSHVARIVTNLVSNARDALPGGGRIIVRTRPAEGSAEFIELSVTDDGEGMDDATRRRLFEPLFTTKGPNGSGLGLATVHALATRWGGYVRVDTALGKGSTFVIGLKRAKSVAPASLPPERRERSGAASRRTALVVDDDPRVRAVTGRFVSALGYRVVVAGATEEAVAILRSGTNVDLVCIDWWMPGAPATLLLDEIAESGRPLPVVVCSGAVDDTVRRVAADRRAALLGKPYGAPELHDKIREAEAIARGLASNS